MRKVFRPMSEKERKKNLLQLWFASEFSSGPVEGSFDNSKDFFSANRENFVTQYSKKMKSFFPKELVCLKKFSWTRKKQFQQTCRKNVQKKPKFFLFPEDPKLKKIIFFSKKIRLTMFLWTKKKLFRPPKWNLFYKKPTIFRSMSASDKNFFSKHFFSTKCFPWHLERSFDEAAGIFSTKNSWKFLLIGRQW